MNSTTTEKIELTVIVPITERFDPISDLYYKYKNSIETLGITYEFIYSLDGHQPEALSELTKLQENEKLTVVTLAKCFGEATVLNAAFGQSSGDIFLTLPAYEQIETKDIPKLVAELDSNDMVLARRWPRKDSFINRFQANAFNFLLSFATSLKMHDAGCSARAFKRKVIDEINIYGDLHRFFPVMAHQQGFRVIEVDIAQAKKDSFARVYSPGTYVRRLLDLLTIFFLVKFTKKPLRFFGLVGSTLLGLGAAITMYLIIDRMFFGVDLGDRPMLVLSSLLIILGIQVIAIGLIGEIIIFTHARKIKEYTIEKIINYPNK